MNDKLICNGLELDLTDRIPVPINLSITDLKDPARRKRNFSKSISLMGTQNNLNFFAGYFSFTVKADTITYDATQKAPAVYEKKGVPILTDALLKLNSITKTPQGVYKFDCTLFSEAVDWFLLLDSLLVSDLDWSSYNHALNRTNIKASWSAGVGSGYYYALVERGKPRLSTTTFSTTDLIPYVYQREVLIKILEFLEVEYSSTFIESAFYKDMLFGYGGGDIKTLSPSQINNRLINLDAGTLTVNKTLYPYPFNVQSSYPRRLFPQNYWTNPFNDLNSTFTTTQDNLAQWDDGKIYVQYAGNYNLSISLSLDYQYSLLGSYTFDNANGFTVVVRKNGITLYTLTQGSAITWDITGGATITASTNTSRSISCNSGDIIEFLMFSGDAYIVDPTDTWDNNLPLAITEASPITIDFTSTDVTLTDGGTVEIGRFLPEMKCSDFLIGQIRQYKLQVSDKDEDGIVKIEPEVDFYKSTNVFDDWTQLLDNDKDVVLKPTANDYKKESVYSFKKLEDFDATEYALAYEEEYGNLKYTQGSYYAKGQDKIELPYGTIIPYEISPNILVPRFIKIDNGTVKPVKGVARVMINNGLKAGNWTLTDTINPTDPANRENLTTYPCVHHFDDYQNPSFDQNFKLVNELFYVATTITTLNTFSKYYFQGLNEMVNIDAKLLTAYFKLNPVDIRNLDFSKLKMLNGSLWRLNQVFDFDSDIQETTKVEMVKVLEAKNPRRKKTVFPNPNLGFQDVISGVFSSPDGVGTDTGVIIGGYSGTSQNSKIIRG